MSQTLPGGWALMLDGDGTITAIGSELARLLGKPADALHGKLFRELVAPRHRQAFDLALAALSRRASVHAETGLLTKSGHETQVALASDGPWITVSDVSGRLELEDLLAVSRESYQLLAETTTDAILQIDSNLIVQFANSAVTRIFGFAREEVEKKSLSILFPASKYDRYRERLRKYFIIDDAHRRDTGLPSVIEVLARKKSGDLIPIEISLGNSRGLGERRVMTCILRDITLRKKADRKLRYLAYYDKLTALGNRDRFADTLTRVLKSVEESTERHAALLYLDLDGFKKINDSMGHEVGDMILKACAQRLINCLREGDEVYRFNFEDVFRLGGDEFTILLPYISKPEDAAIVAKRVVDNITQPFSVSGWADIENIRLGVSVGIALIPEDGNDKTTLLRNADAAMYKAKERGNRYVFFTEDMNNRALERLKLEEGIRKALVKNEFELRYMPIVDSSAQVVSVEALVRWRHPERGVLPPNEFIGVSEEIGLIGVLGTWVLATAAKDLRRMRESVRADLRVNVNVSPLQLERDNLGETVRNVLARAGLSPETLTLELTESSLMESPERSRGHISSIKKANPGVQFAIDDFGTGYSSLAYLAAYPADTLKIDRSFVSNLGEGHNTQIVKTIVDLGKSLGMSVTAEGVETREQFDLLRTNGCTLYQGALFGLPIPLDALTARLGAADGGPFYDDQSAESSASEAAVSTSSS